MTCCHFQGALTVSIVHLFIYNNGNNWWRSTPSNTDPKYKSVWNSDKRSDYFQFKLLCWIVKRQKIVNNLESAVPFRTLLAAWVPISKSFWNLKQYSSLSVANILNKHKQIKTNKLQACSCVYVSNLQIHSSTWLIFLNIITESLFLKSV